jgi:hypothetical protein
MGVNYNALAATAKRLVGSNGTKCVLVNPGEDRGEYNPDTNEYDKKEEERFEGYCIVSGYEDKLVDGTVIKAGDRKVTAVLPAEPNPGLSRLEVYNRYGKLAETYNVINSNTVNPNLTTVIVYKLQCRK